MRIENSVEKPVNIMIAIFSVKEIATEKKI